MNQTTERQFLPALLGALHQEKASGELILVQNDAERRLFWDQGALVYLKSDAGGEQLGNHLIRHGVLDHSALQELLAAKDDVRFGDKVVQWGLVTVEERNHHLQRLLEQILLHALEHDVISMVWEAGPIQEKLSADLRFRLDHKRLVWEAFQQIRDLTHLVDLLFEEPSWRWQAGGDLLVDLADFTLTPEIAYALSLLGFEPIGYETFMSITQMDEEDAARLLVTLWALGSLTLSEGELPRIMASGQAEAGVDPANFSTGQIPIFGAGEPVPQPPVPSSPTPGPPRGGAAPLPPPPPIPVPVSWSEPVLPPQPLFQPPIPQLPTSETWGTLPQRPPGGQAPAPPAAAVPQVPWPAFEPILPAREDITHPGVQVEESPKERARSLVRKAKTEMIQEKTAEAVRHLEDSVRLDPDSRQSFEAWLLLGKLRQSNPAWANRAVEALQQAAQVNSLSAEPWALLGELYHRKGFRTHAVGCYRKALDLDPSTPVPPDLGMEDPPAGKQPSKVESGGLVGKLRGLFS